MTNSESASFVHFVDVHFGTADDRAENYQHI